MVQRVLDIFVAKRLPSALHQDSVRYVHLVFFRLVSRLLMLLPLPKFLADPQELDLLPEKIAITVPLVFEKIAHLLHVRDA